MGHVITDLIYNAALLIALGVIYDVLALHRYSQTRKPWFQLLTGLLLSLIAMAVMSRPWQIVPGIRIDARSILLAVTGLFFGLTPTLTVVVTTLIYRMILGGIGTETGYGLIITSAALGLTWRYLRQRHLVHFHWAELYSFGIIVHIGMLLWMFNLPSPLDIQVLQNITLPVMILYPIVTVLLSQLLAHKTAQRATRDSLQLSESNYRRIVGSVDQGIWVINEDGITTFVNPKLVEISGYSEQELVGHPLHEFIPELRAVGSTVFLKVLRLNTRRTFEAKYTRKNGDVIWTLINLAPLHNDEGTFEGGLALITDIDAQKRAEQELQNRGNLIETILSNLPIGVAVIDTDTGHLNYVNQHYLDLMGWEDDYEQHDTVDLFTVSFPEDESRDNILTEAESNLSGQSPVPLHYESIEITRADGSTHLIDGSAWPIPEQHLVILTARDVTERQRMENALRASEQRFKNVFEQSAVGVAQVNPDNRIQIANARLSEILGYTNEELIGKSYIDLTWPEDRELTRERILNVRQQQHDKFAYEARSSHKQNYPVWVRINGNIVRDEQQNHIYSVIMVSDITESRRIDEEKRSQQELLQSIIDNIPVMIAMNDAEGQYVFCNRAYQETMGWDVTEFDKPDEMLALVYPDPEQRRRVIDEIDDGDLVWRDYTSHTRDGRALHTSWANAVLSGGEHLGFGMDISERKNAELAIQQQSELLQTIVDHIPVMLNITDPEGRFIFMNRTYQDFLGWSMDEIETIDEMLTLAYPDPEERQFIRSRIDTCDGHWLDAKVRTRYGHDISMSWIDIRLPNGNHLGIGQDITARVEAEQQMREMNMELERRVAQRTAELESRNRELQTFTYSVSHDLKAPLRGIDGYSRLIELQYADKLDGEGKHFVRQVRGATDLMNTLIEDLLAYSRLEQQPLLIQPIKLGTWIDRLLVEMSPQIENSNVEVRVDIPDISLRTDVNGLTIVMRNLVDNALKFTSDIEQPTLEIGGEQRDTCCWLWVRDNGIGFDMQFHDRIFGIFQRLHRAEDYPGTGVGLAIVQRAMQRMGGRVWAESHPGQGAIFYLEIPLDHV